jgi:ssDNA-binding Zn-finger/Zn-ribbon topoisomerase 1
MDQIDNKYIGLLSSRLAKFKRVKANLYNFRCPICGDSQRNRNKARGYFYVVKNNTNFKCHNCGISLSFNNFLKQTDSELHKQFTLEKFKNGFTGKNFTTDTPSIVEEVAKDSVPKFEKDPIKELLPRASDIQRSRDYLVKRKIDPSKFYYAERFKEFVNQIKFSFSDTSWDDERIIIPLYRNKQLIGLQGRSLGPSSNKYITIMLSEDEPKIYGLDQIDKELPVFITEGPFDSTFIRNAIAMCGADLDISNWGISDPVWIYDNEPRNAEIHSRISNVISRGERVVIWPSGIREKDINDMILSGLDVQSVIESNIYSGLEAKLKFTTWKKI